MENSIWVTKEATFDCAHMLTGHEGLCKNLHGHTYKVQVSVTGRPLTEGPSMGMIIDFKHLKRAMQEVIISQFDHAVIFSDIKYRGQAENALYVWAVSEGMRYVILPERTTAENMAKFFKKRIFEYLVEELELHNITDVSIRLYETPTSYAEV